MLSLPLTDRPSATSWIWWLRALIEAAQVEFDFTRKLTINPWHCLHEHRPLGNQSRARRRMYYELSRLRIRMNETEHVEPTGEEQFP